MSSETTEPTTEPKSNVSDIVESVKESKETSKESKKTKTPEPALSVPDPEPSPTAVVVCFNENRIYATNFKAGSGYYRIYVKTKLGDKNKLVHVSHIGKILIPNDFDGEKAISITEFAHRKGRFGVNVIQPNAEIAGYLEPTNNISFATKQCCGG